MINQELISLPGVVELLKRTWQIYTARIRVFLGIMILYLPFGLVITYFSRIPDVNPFSSFILTLLVFPFSIWVGVALIYAVKEGGEKIGIRASLAKGWPKIISFFWIYLLAGFISMGGLLLFVIPGIILTIWFILAPYILVSENLRGMNALFRSKQLVSGYWWSIFGRFLVMWIIFLVIYLPFVFLSEILKGQFFIAVTFPIIPSIFLSPFTIIYSFLIYEGLRKLKAEVVFEPPKRGTKIKFLLIGIVGFLLIPLLILGILLVTFLAAILLK